MDREDTIQTAFIMTISHDNVLRLDWAKSVQNASSRRDVFHILHAAMIYTPYQTPRI